MRQVSDYRLEQEECSCNSDPDLCGCLHCHNHKEHHWQEWTVYPTCEWCLFELSVWLGENTDYFTLQRQFGRAA